MRTRRKARAVLAAIAAALWAALAASPLRAEEELLLPPQPTPLPFNVLAAGSAGWRIGAIQGRSRDLESNGFNLQHFSTPEGESRVWMGETPGLGVQFLRYDGSYRLSDGTAFTNADGVSFGLQGVSLFTLYGGRRESVWNQVGFGDEEADEGSSFELAAYLRAGVSYNKLEAAEGGASFELLETATSLAAGLQAAWRLGGRLRLQPHAEGGIGIYDASLQSTRPGAGGLLGGAAASGSSRRQELAGAWGWGVDLILAAGGGGRLELDLGYFVASSDVVPGQSRAVLFGLQYRFGGR